MKTNTNSVAVKLIIIVIGGFASVYVGINYYKAWKGPDLQPYPKDYCFKCHSDAKTIKMMRMKEGLDDEESPGQIKSKRIEPIHNVRKLEIYPLPSTKHLSK